MHPYREPWRTAIVRDFFRGEDGLPEEGRDEERRRGLTEAQGRIAWAHNTDNPFRAALYSALKQRR